MTLEEARHRAQMPARHLWVAPAFDGPPTGGTIYNSSLCRASSEKGIANERVSVDQATRALSSGNFDCCWVDTLYFDRVPDLVRSNISGMPLRLVVHYLPSLVDPRNELRASLRAKERALLERVDECLVPSRYMASVLGELGVPEERIEVLEPGAHADFAPSGRDRRASAFRAIVVANLTPAKGVYAFLERLASALSSETPFRLAVVGSSRVDAEYARRCRALVESHPSLARSVEFLGALTHERTLVEMSHSDVFVSASTMESYGMAIAEARALGLPVLALRGGNAENLVETGAGGRVFDEVDSLVLDLIRLTGDEAELESRKSLARKGRRARTWAEAAEEFVTRFGSETGPRGGRSDHGDTGRRNRSARTRWETWTIGHSLWMLALLFAAWAARTSWIPAWGGASTLLLLVALARGGWTDRGVLGWANAVTLARLALVVAVASSPGVGPLEAFGALAILCLDGVDGRVARRRREVSEFGAKLDMETDALFIATLCMKLAVVGRLGPWILVPGLLRYVYAIAIGLPETHGEAPRTRFGRYVFAIQATSLAAALWPLDPIFAPFAVLATLLTVHSFARSLFWSLGAAGVRAEHRATG